MALQDNKISEKLNNIVGVDEVGRGALAGPVVVSAVILNEKCPIKELKDSKKLSEKKRNELYEKLIITAPYIRTCIINHTIVDQINVLNATLKGMLYCIKKIAKTSHLIYIDGNKVPKNDTYNMKAIIKGDNYIPAISAASIIAKVSRDNYMKKIHHKSPQYNHIKHKGYGTEEHLNAIFTYGKSNYHRKTFNVNKQLTLI